MTLIISRDPNRTTDVSGQSHRTADPPNTVFQLNPTNPPSYFVDLTQEQVFGVRQASAVSFKAPAGLDVPGKKGPFGGKTKQLLTRRTEPGPDYEPTHIVL